MNSVYTEIPRADDLTSPRTTSIPCLAQQTETFFEEMIYQHRPQVAARGNGSRRGGSGHSRIDFDITRGDAEMGTAGGILDLPLMHVKRADLATDRVVAFFPSPSRLASGCGH